MNKNILNLDLTQKKLINFISIFTYINYCIVNDYELDEDDIRFLEILEEYSYLLRD